MQRYKTVKCSKVLCGYLLAVMMSGCSTIDLDKELPVAVPEQFKVNSDIWQKEKRVDLTRWWSQFDDKELTALIEAGQENSPTISSALVNISSYELALTNARANMLPDLSAHGSTTYGSKTSSTQLQAGLQTSWEIDLFTKHQLSSAANEKLLQGAQALWHDARTLVAAQVAQSYFNHRFCSQSLRLLEQDLQSRIKQDELTKVNISAGLQARTSQYLSEATIAQSKANMLNKQLECDMQIKGLVALTGWPEERLVSLLSSKPELDYLSLAIPSTLPGDLLTQRPDVFNAINALEAASLSLASVKMERYPSVSIQGSLQLGQTIGQGVSISANQWSIGPLTISVPIFDGGKQKANENPATTKYQHARIELTNTLRQAIKEVEVALLSLSISQSKAKILQESAHNYQASYEATLARYKAGLSPLYELETSRISYLSAVNNEMNNRQDSMKAWIDLYKSLGGGFDSKDRKIKIEEKNDS